MNKIKFRYSLDNACNRSFVKIIPIDLKVKDILEIISKRHKGKCTALFLDGSEIDLDDEISYYWEDDIIFTVSIIADPPLKEVPSPKIPGKIGPPSEKNINQPIMQQPSPKIPSPKIPGKIGPPSAKNINQPIMQQPSPKIPGKIEPPSAKNTNQPMAQQPSPKIPGKNLPIRPTFPAKEIKAPLRPIGPPKKASELSHATPQIKTPTVQSQPPEIQIPLPKRETSYITFREYMSQTPIDHSEEEIEQYSKKIKNKFTFYFTGGDKNMLLKGIDVELSLEMNPKQCNDALLKYIKERIDVTNLQLIVYLPGGIPFIGGTLNDIFNNSKIQVKNVIYGVLIRNIGDDIICEIFNEVCNIKDQNHKNLISPLVESTERGLSDMACILGYLYHDGMKSEHFHTNLSSFIHFPPLITSMKRIIDHNNVTGRDIITVTSTLYTYFRILLPSYCPNRNVLDYTLLLCNILLYIENFINQIPLIKLNIKSEDETTKFLSNLKLEKSVYFWKGDAGVYFEWTDVKIQIDEAIENSNKFFNGFTPIEPLNMRYADSCTIVKGKNYEYLFLKHGTLKDNNSQSHTIIDPYKGNAESVDIESFALKEKSDSIDFIPKIISQDKIKQIIMINFDKSISMYSDLDGNPVTENEDKHERIFIGYQLLSLFIDRLYYNYIPSIQGIVTFNDEILFTCPFGPLKLTPDVGNLQKTVTNSSSKLWDSLSFSCSEIVKFRKDNEGNEIYKNAVSRILVISSGKDHNSEVEVHHVVKELISHKIIVDSIVLGKNDKRKMLCAISHATGGISLHFKNYKEDIHKFDQSAIFNYEERYNNFKPLISDDMNTVPLNFNKQKITKHFIKKARDNAVFDDCILNKATICGCENVPLSTPRNICSQYSDSLIPNLRINRILRELHICAEYIDKTSDNYDPDIKIFTFQSNIDIWKVFFKNSNVTGFKKEKWWYLLVTFPDLYPFYPPNIRFITVPYHPNISIDGFICIDSLDRKYNQFFQTCWKINFFDFCFIKGKFFNCL